MADINYIQRSNHLAAKEVHWRHAVGRFILSFGSVEWFTFHMLAELPTERILESTIRLRFGQRLDIIKQLFRERNFEPALSDKAISLLEKARELSRIRNLLAHNPLILNLFDDKVGIDLEYQISKYGEIKAQLTIDDLNKYCREVEELDEQLSVIREEIEDALS